MKKVSFTFFLCVFILFDVFAQEPIDTEPKIITEQASVDNLFKKKKFTVELSPPSLFWGKRLDIIGVKKINLFQGLKGSFYYNFTEIISLGLTVSFTTLKVLFVDNTESRHLTLNFSPSVKVNLGKNQMFVPFVEASYVFSKGKYDDDNAEDYYTNKYLRHIINGAIGVDIYASRWFKKTKYKNNFGITLAFSNAIFLFDNSINVPLTDRSGGKSAIFYKF